MKFIRFAQWKINQAGEGVLGFITNHSYLDNPTFRGMRQSLMNSFNEIYILDLHGNSLKKEKCPDGSKDENVFDIQQGVAIALFIKKREEQKEAKVYHSEVWGLRKKKNDWLSKNDVKTATWRKLSPKPEFYLFIPRDERLLESYEKYPKITAVFPLNSVGIVTSRDSFVIDFDKEALKRRIKMFCNENMPDELVKQTFNLKDKSNWKLKIAREKVRKDEDWENSITKILYRPFDIRWIFYHHEMIERSRKEVMRHMLTDNLSICFMRQVSLEEGYTHFLVSEHMVDNRTFLSSKGIIQQAPLYLYPDTDKKDLFSPEKRQPNISPELFAALSEVFKKDSSPEEIFYYIYAVLYSNIYRTKYAEFLKLDFPRIPFIKDYQIFGKMAEHGKRLVDLHLLKSAEIDQPIAKFQGKGDDRVDKLRYDEKEKRTYINESQYFEGITKEIWEYQIGGYQVCNKWLKDRKKKLLSLDDIKHYCKIVTSIQKTIEVQKAIDDIYPEVEKGTVEIENR